MRLVWLSSITYRLILGNLQFAAGIVGTVLGSGIGAGIIAFDAFKIHEAQLEILSQSKFLEDQLNLAATELDRLRKKVVEFEKLQKSRSVEN